MNQLTLDFARGDVAKLDKECKEAFQLGSERRDMFAIYHCWEYHRLHQLREEARERVRHWERALGIEPANDTTRPAAER